MMGVTYLALAGLLQPLHQLIVLVSCFLCLRFLLFCSVCKVVAFPAIPLVPLRGIILHTVDCFLFSLVLVLLAALALM